MNTEITMLNYWHAIQAGQQANLPLISHHMHPLYAPDPDTLKIPNPSIVNTNSVISILSSNVES